MSGLFQKRRDRRLTHNNRLWVTAHEIGKDVWKGLEFEPTGYERGVVVLPDGTKLGYYSMRGLCFIQRHVPIGHKDTPKFNLCRLQDLTSWWDTFRRLKKDYETSKKIKA